MKIDTHIQWSVYALLVSLMGIQSDYLCKIILCAIAEFKIDTCIIYLRQIFGGLTLNKLAYFIFRLITFLRNNIKVIFGF